MTASSTRDAAGRREAGSTAVEERADLLARKSVRVGDALVQAGAEPEAAAVRPDPSAVHRTTAYAVLLGVVAVLWFAARAGIGADAPWVAALRSATRLAVVPAALLLAGATVERWVLARLRDPVARHNLVRVSRLVAWLLSLAVVAALTFRTWYPFLVSLGVVTLVLGFALQTPLTSFFGWIYILLRAPYRVGDRIRVGDAVGDVIDLSYLDTTLWEVGGPHLSTPHPSGRIIRVPNSVILQRAVYNYSWPLFPYVWAEVVLQVAYGSDLRFVADTLVSVADEELGPEMSERVKVYRELLSRTPVRNLQIDERPNVVFRAAETWVEVVLRYLVHPKEMGSVRSRILVEALDRLNAQPERVLLPRSNAR